MGSGKDGQEPERAGLHRPGMWAPLQPFRTISEPSPVCKILHSCAFCRLEGVRNELLLAVAAPQVLEVVAGHRGEDAEALAARVHAATMQLFWPRESARQQQLASG